MKNTKMTSYERVFAIINNKDYDILPAINPTSVATLDAMALSNSYFPEANTNPEKMAKLAAVGHSYFGFDSISPYFSVCLESAALGAEVDWGELSSPQITKRPMKHIEDLNLPKNFLRLPEFQQLLTAIKILKKEYKDSVPIIGKVIGPWTLAYNLYGYGNLTLDMILEPRKVSALINELSTVSVTFAKAQFEAGASLVTWADHATSDTVSKVIYDELLLPVHKKAAGALKSYGPIILHVCGNVMDRISSIAEAGFPIFHIDSRNDISKALEIVNGKILLTGTINNPLTLGQNNSNAVKKEVLENLKKGIKLISPECALPLNVPEKNLLTLTKTVHNFRKDSITNL